MLEDRVAGAEAIGVAAIYEGAARVMAAYIGGVMRQIIRAWVVRFSTPVTS